ncbi:putative pterin-4-alpha-carbinolamine dehydratase [Bacterioplanes sanyensis]|jgi:4a-hydroxytetrahydrobiopterin dehydratase|uniref:4a-hydroxytetrahydrobiopterin dehydratase n=1 Tax=Bacterioplanes sanyensis TaxID=1249553 RepID=UPI001677532F|nr:4a-hydroxytetrahydrobiopterin dehydratase [Bacterioplanes sanyensis]GGY36711.1 putative pterin-4-alpha-carbinolamine dehydratase [Bacterioplanes sanyensis]
MSDKLNDEAIVTALSTLPQWQKQLLDGVAALQKDFRFNDFAGAMAFAQKVATLADEHDHHPQLTITYGHVEVLWWSHDVNGVSERDVRLAELCEALV